ncbi:EcoRII N-terminal effector-binding domain-containing protein [Agreia sp. Leaf283]|uniref:EcoRII N-terminal effector-binding domain-containing protein n=1 Tax=Agreia sp. Leaf283 TaxID=1736321 RepID=UPI00072A4F6E|nr:EcoRII N-terminal effector-binding domain-containing protein [Agreia sp. Leaf283]KQP57184.1 hypothetical protein ASF51_04750 [Agreia sp. Leaf283]
MIRSGSSVQKKLSANDVGDTGGHQDGILIPKHVDILNLLPKLPTGETNPRLTVRFEDLDDGEAWSFQYIYYNGKTLGHSTRDEYRLTGFSGFYRKHNAVQGGYVELSRSSDNKYYIRYTGPAAELAADEDDDVVVLSGTWTTIRSRTR